jgi:glutamyl-tRNA synthetase
MPITRLAPSPTGALHLGNARTFLVNWLLARREGWKIILRIEDLDGPRVKTKADQQAIDDLQWLGLDWNEGPVYQSARTDLYRAAIDRLIAAKLAYPCICSRKDAESAASAPHAEDGSAVYPGTCRDRFTSIDDARNASDREPAIRFRVPNEIVEFDDGFRGTCRFDMARLGDFVIAKANGIAAYHLAVVIDDQAMGITDIVRGDDLLDSTARHLLLYEALGLADYLPRWFHLPLVVGGDGRRLAKRHGDTRLEYYRRNGASPGRLRALLARWCGIECGDEIEMAELLERFSLQAVPKERIVFGPSDDSWILRK